MACAVTALPHAGQPAEVIEAISGYWLWSAAALVPFALMLADKQVLDAVDKPWLGVAVAAAAVGVNACVAVWLVHGGPGAVPMGLTGAGIATFVAYTAGWLAYRWLALVRDDLRCWLAAPTACLRAVLREQQRQGAPMGLQYLLECGATAAAGGLMGLFGAVALAANQVTMSIVMTLYMVPLGLATAVGLRLSQAIGSADTRALRDTTAVGLWVVTLWMGGFSLLLAIGGPRLATAFTEDPAVVATAGSLFVAVAAMQVADGLQSVGLGALRGLLDSRWPTLVSLCCYWGLALPLAWWIAMPLGVGPAGVWIGFGMGLAVAAWALHARLRWRIEALVFESTAASATIASRKN